MAAVTADGRQTHPAHVPCNLFRPAQVQVERASATNPGLPPSSLMGFLRVNASIQGMMLTDFDSQYINPYFQSEYDDGFNVTIQVGYV